MMITYQKCGAYIFVVEFFYSQKGGGTTNGSMVHITIDGKEYSAEPGSTILGIINENEIEHPQICYVPEVDPIQTCDTCIVEVNGKLVRSCSTVVTDGMNIELSSISAKAAQHEVMDRLLENHLLYCTVCDSNNGNCKLHNTAELMEIEHQKYPYEPKVDANEVDMSHPFIPFFLKKNYEMLVAFPEDKQEESNEGVAQFHEQLMDVVGEPSEEIVKANGIQSVLHNLENVTTPMSYAAMQTGNSEEWARKKEKLLQLFEKRIIVVKHTEETKVTKKQSAVKQAIPVKKEEVAIKKEKQESVPFIIQKVIRMLEQNDVEQYFIHAYAEKLKVKFESATMITEEEVIGYILEDMRFHFNTENVFEKEVQTIALIGPTGVGKTTALAKMAVSWEEKTVGFITTDHSRIGTVQQLQYYVKTIGSEVIAVRDESAMTRALTYFKEEARVDYILIDTAGKNYRTSETVEEMIETMGRVEPDYICLTLSVSMKSKDMIEIITNFKDIHIDGIVFTKFDETASSGELLKIPAVSSAPIVLMTDGQDVKQHIHIATAEHLAKQMLQTS